jgi:hypothetical protein
MSSGHEKTSLHISPDNIELLIPLPCLPTANTVEVRSNADDVGGKKEDESDGQLSPNSV